MILLSILLVLLNFAETNQTLFNIDPLSILNTGHIYGIIRFKIKLIIIITYTRQINLLCETKKS
jgi:hypothetical protein